MYVTNRPVPAGWAVPGPLVVSMRPMTPEQAVSATRVSARFPAGPRGAGAFWRPGPHRDRSLGQPDFGDAVDVRPGEVPVFWACGVTPQAALAGRAAAAITHKPGHMFLTDLRDADLEGK